MHRIAYSWLVVLLALANRASAAEPQPKVVIPFDFESKFDQGAYGRTIGEMIWAKLQRQGGFVVPESMLDVRDCCQREKLFPNPDTPLDKLKPLVREEFNADIAIWGKVERVAGNEWDVYDVWIYAADFKADPVKMIHQAKVRTKTVSEIPHVYLAKMLDDLYGRKPGAPAGPNPDAEALWKTGPNLVAGDFEKGRAGPDGWDPLPPQARWIDEAGAKSKNRVIRFSFGEDVAGTTGVLYYSDFFPVEEGATYRFQCRWRSTGSAAKVFIKCYDDLPGQYGVPGAASESGSAAKTAKPAKSAPAARPGKKPGGDSAAGTYRPGPSPNRREVYRSQQNLKGPAKTWNVQTEDFTPKHTLYSPKWGRVMLYAYWPAGTVDWDDVVVKQIVPASPSVKLKEKRPSLETKVTTKEIEEQERTLREREKKGE
ncbi:MAG: hypothetical protein ACYC35_03995 [Pirellulales bacterium]